MSAVRLFSVYMNGWRPDSGQRVYTEKAADPRVLPLGQIYEPDARNADQYTRALIAAADEQIPLWQAQGVNGFYFNGEKVWGIGGTVAAQALAAALSVVRIGHAGALIGGCYGMFADDSGAAAEPGKDRFGRNLLAAQELLPVVGCVELSVYPIKGRDGKPETINGSMVEPVLRRAWHQVQQARALYPGVDIRLFVSDQCLQNGVPGPLAFVPAGEFAKAVAVLARMPAVTALVHWSGYDDVANGGRGGGVPLTAGMSAARAAFADAAAAA